MDNGLSPPEQMVLQGLGREDYSHYGECKSTALQVLIGRGLAEITNPENGDWALVSLTETGIAALTTTPGAPDAG